MWEPYTLVFEDDVMLKPGWREALGTVLREVRDQDVVYLGHCFEACAAAVFESVRRCCV